MTYVCYIDTIIISLGNDGYNKYVDIKYMFPWSIFKHVKKNPRHKILDTWRMQSIQVRRHFFLLH
jgi:hypothetical protein